MPRHNLISDAARGALLAAAMLALGCSSTQPVARIPRGTPVGNQGGSWEVVLSTPEAPPWNGWEYSRADDSMNIRTELEPGPALDDLRRIYINPRPDQVLYFRRAPHRHW